MEFVQIKCRVRGKSRSFWWCKHYSVIWSNSREHSKNVFAVNLGHRNNVHKFWRKTFSEVLENQTRLQNSTDTMRKSLIFGELCALLCPQLQRSRGAYYFWVVCPSVCPSIRLSVRSSRFLMHSITLESWMLLFWNFLYGFLMKK